MSQLIVNDLVRHDVVQADGATAADGAVILVDAVGLGAAPLTGLAGDGYTSPTAVVGLNNLVRFYERDERRRLRGAGAAGDRMAWAVLPRAAGSGARAVPACAGARGDRDGRHEDHRARGSRSVLFRRHRLRRHGGHTPTDSASSAPSAERSASARSTRTSTTSWTTSSTYSTCRTCSTTSARANRFSSGPCRANDDLNPGRIEIGDRRSE